MEGPGAGAASAPTGTSAQPGRELVWPIRAADPAGAEVRDGGGSAQGSGHEEVPMQIRRPINELETEPSGASSLGVFGTGISWPNAYDMIGAPS